MGQVNEMVLDIEYLLEKGLSFAQVARELEIPVHFVVEAAEVIEKMQQEDDCSPFATINS